MFGVYLSLFSPFPMRHANTVMTIFGFTSTRSSGRAYIRAPILRATEMAYLEKTRKKIPGIWHLLCSHLIYFNKIINYCDRIGLYKKVTSMSLPILVLYKPDLSRRM